VRRFVQGCLGVLSGLVVFTALDVALRGLRVMRIMVMALKGAYVRLVVGPSTIRQGHCSIIPGLASESGS